MPGTITLKNKANADVVFTFQKSEGGVAYFVSAGANLLDTKVLSLGLKNGSKTNRITGKLSLPAVATDAAGLPFVAYTQVSSFDFSAVRIAPGTALDDMTSMTGSLCSNANVAAMVKTGILPA